MVDSMAAGMPGAFRIARLEIVPYALRFREPYVTARGRLDRRELLLVRLWAEAGKVGLGEGAPLLLRGGASLDEIAGELAERCRPLLEGAQMDPTDPLKLVAGCSASGISPQARAAVELALLDLAGKAAGRPVWDLLGAQRAEPVRCNATLSAGEPESVAKRAVTFAERGYRTFKLKVGTGADYEQVLAVREALGAGPLIRVDANGTWEEKQAVAELAQMQPLGIELAEQPVSTLAAMAAVRAQTLVPIAADESVASAEEARAAAEARACDLATVKIAKVGGIEPALEIAASLPVYLSSALDGPVGIAAAAHLAQALPREGFAAGLAHGLATAELFRDRIASRCCEVVEATLTPTDAPGLGVEIDERALERCAL